MMTEQEYRALPSEKYFSSSLLKSFDEYGPKILQTPKEISNDGMIFGSLVDTMCFSNEIFDDIYYVSEAERKLTVTEKKLYDGIIHILDDEMFNMKYLDSDEFSELCLMVIKDDSLWNNIKKDDILLSKIDKNFKNHIIEFKQSQSKEIVSKQDYIDARYTTKILLEHDFSKEFFNSKDLKKKQVLFQIPILFKINKDNFKSLLDIILIDHEKKIIRVIDLKTGAKPNKYFLNEFLKRRYDIQGALYTKALETYILEKDLKEYNILNPIFLYVCRFTPDVPLPYYVDNRIVKGAFTGFKLRSGREYEGIIKLTNDINWHRENNLYDYTADQYKEKGQFINSDTLNIYDILSKFDNNLFTNYTNGIYVERITNSQALGREIEALQRRRRGIDSPGQHRGIHWTSQEEQLRAAMSRNDMTIGSSGYMPTPVPHNPHTTSITPPPDFAVEDDVVDGDSSWELG